MNSNSPYEKDACPLSCLPFLTLKYPKGYFPGSRTKCSFILIPPDKIEVETMITHAGGQVLLESQYEEENEYAITILCERFYLQHPDADCVLPLDTFSSVYVYEAIENAKKNLPFPSLNSFRITSSKYHSFKPEEIMWKQIKWSDLIPLAKPTKKRITAQQFVERLQRFWDSPPLNPVLNNHYTSSNAVDKIDEQPTTSNDNKASPKFSQTATKKKKTRKILKIFTLKQDNGSTTNVNNEATLNGYNEIALNDQDNKARPIIYKRAKSKVSKKSTALTLSLDTPKSESIKNSKIPPCPLRFKKNKLKKSEEVSLKKDTFDKTKVSVVSEVPKSSKRFFTLKEGQKILDIICEKNAFMYTKGDKLFQWMELSQHFPGRTYQSLKEHWKKKVQPNVLTNTIYQISPANMDKLVYAERNYRWKKHSNVCPDFDL